MRKPRRLPQYCYEDTDRHGNVRVYLRKPGQPKVRLRGVVWTPEFMAAYEFAVNGTIASVKTKGAKPATWRWLCEEYLKSPEFNAHATSTQSARRGILESTWDEPIKPGASLCFGDMPLAKMTPKAIRVLRNRKSEFPFAADTRVKAIRVVFVWGLEHLEEAVQSNPARNVSLFARETEGHHPWSEDEIRKFMAFYAPGKKERRAMALILYTGARGCDVRLFGPQHMKNGRFVFNQQKTKDWVDLPVLEELSRELALAPHDALAFIVTEYGKTFSQKGFGNWFNGKCREAGLENCTAHGLRKGAATIAANNGATIHQLMAIFGWLSEQMAILYTKTVNRKKLADSGIGFIRLEQNVS